MIWNPWKRIRELEARIGALKCGLEYERNEADRRIGRAIAAHYNRIQYEDRAREAQLQAMQSAVCDMNSLRGFSFADMSVMKEPGK